MDTQANHWGAEAREAYRKAPRELGRHARDLVLVARRLSHQQPLRLLTLGEHIADARVRAAVRSSPAAAAVVLNCAERR